MRLDQIVITPEVEALAKRMFDAGYMASSNKYRIATRIDREDWVEFMAKKFSRSVADFYMHHNGELTQSTGHWGEHYCQVFSKDKIESLPPALFVALKKLNLYQDVVYKSTTPEELATIRRELANSRICINCGHGYCHRHHGVPEVDNPSDRAEVDCG